MKIFAANVLKNFFCFFLLAALLSNFSSCLVVKNHPVKQPFVYSTNISINGKFTTDERKELINRLNEQLHDSIRVRTSQKLIGWENGPRFFYSVLNRPPLFDSLNADKSIIYMRALLSSLGYYRDSIGYDTALQVKDKQYRTAVNFTVLPGKQFKLDSILYTIDDDTLQKITKEAQNESLLKKGEPFAKPLISSEIDRLTDVYRNNGYLRFSRDELLAVWDTVGIALLRPTVDPLEQAQLIEAVQRRRENPVADIEIRLRENEDTTHLIRYRVGNVTVYPDLMVDTIHYKSKVIKHESYTIVSYQDLFRPKVITENIYLNRGELYSQRKYLQTLNRFNSLGAWRLVSIDQVPRAATDTVDFVIRLTPAPKYVFDANIEGSQNWGTVFTQGNLIGVNFGLQNRNFARGANQANTSFRFGTEVTAQRFVQTKQISFGHTIYFPRVIPRFRGLPQSIKENFRTSLAFNTNYITRLDFLDVLSVNGSWGYEFNWRNKLLSLRLPNIEYAFLRIGPDLKRLIDQNRSFRYIFNDGLVSSVITSYTVTGGQKNITTLKRFNLEASGLVSGLLRSKFLDSNLYRFIKLDADFRQTIKIRRSAFAWRAFGGAGYELLTRDPNKRHLPFFKAYYAGGANSMRAWALRKLGPGSTVKSFARDSFPDRFADIQLEINGEYRFFLADIQGVKLNSALFTDIGNIWYLRKNELYPEGEFRFSKLWKDLAIGAGTGLRIDFGLFLVRLDYAYKVKDPSPEKPEWQNKLFPDFKVFGGQIQIGVTYPF